MTAMADPLLEVADLQVWYPTKRRGEHVRAVDGVSLQVHQGETLGLIGESGSGKSTLGRALLDLAPIHDGSIKVEGVDLRSIERRQRRRARTKVQMVFQDPTASLDPRMTIGASVEEPLRVQRRGDRTERRNKALAALDRVGLSPEHAARYPHELSGGQKQRANIARALILEPSLLVCDESVSALDVSMQAEILQLLQSLQDDLGLAYLFITHDLGVVSNVADRVAVMYLGHLMEVAPVDSLVEQPLHPYTEALVSAQPSLRPGSGERIVLVGDVPSPIDPPQGCRFHTRCPYAQERCAQEVPPWRELQPSHFVACHYADSLSLRGAASTIEAAEVTVSMPTRAHELTTNGHSEVNFPGGTQ